MATPANPADGEDTRPVPDPTSLTTAALLREIGHVKELTQALLERAEDLRNEKFDSVQSRLESAEEQRREQKQDTGKAIDAALMAQREAANKSEGAISKQLEQMQTNFNISIGNLNRELGDIKDRVTRMEAVKLGVTESRAGLYAAVGIAITVILAVLSVIAFSQGGG